jgi:hypothetical protein
LRRFDPYGVINRALEALLLPNRNVAPLELDERLVKTADLDCSKSANLRVFFDTGLVLRLPSLRPPNAAANGMTDFQSN